MKKVVVITGIVIIASLFGGCTNLTMLRTQELREIQTHVDSLHTNLATMQEKLLAEQKTNSEMLRLMRADQQVRFSELDQKVSSIEASLSESQYRLSKIDEKTAAMQENLAKASSANSRESEIQKLFDIAMSDFNAGRYDIAISGFKDLVTQFPESPLAKDAEYWTAESYYAKKEYEEAEKAYIAFIKKYSSEQGEQFCTALYKLGLTYDKQNKAKSKKMVWKKLIEQCPDAREAELVKNQMR
jgi:tol-pal system protein YbgF